MKVWLLLALSLTASTGWAQEKTPSLGFAVLVNGADNFSINDSEFEDDIFKISKNLQLQRPNILNSGGPGSLRTVPSPTALLFEKKYSNEAWSTLPLDIRLSLRGIMGERVQIPSSFPGASTASQKNLEDLVQMASRQKPKDFFVYFTDHGSVRGPTLWGAETTTHEELSQIFRGLPTETRVRKVIDYCYGGKTLIPPGAGPLEKMTGRYPANQCGIASALPDELAYNGNNFSSFIKKGTSLQQVFDAALMSSDMTSTPNLTSHHFEDEVIRKACRPTLMERFECLSCLLNLKPSPPLSSNAEEELTEAASDVICKMFDSGESAALDKEVTLYGGLRDRIRAADYQCRTKYLLKKRPQFAAQFTLFYRRFQLARMEALIKKSPDSRRAADEAYGVYVKEANDYFMVYANLPSDSDYRSFRNKCAADSIPKLKLGMIIALENPLLLKSGGGSKPFSAEAVEYKLSEKYRGLQYKRGNAYRKERQLRRDFVRLWLEKKIRTSEVGPYLELKERYDNILQCEAAPL